MARTGLLFRAALLLLRVFPATATGQLFALLFGGVLITPLVPLSVARVAAIMPVASEIGQSLGFAPRSNGSARIAFAGLTGYWYFSSIFLTGLATNFFVVQLLLPADRARFSWLGWLAAALPVGIFCLAGAAATMLLRFVLPSRPTMLLLSLAVVPAAPQLGISPWLAGVTVLLAANVWILPYQGLEYLIAREATGGQAFDDRQGTRMGAALTAVRFVAIAASVPFWKLMGLLG